MHEARGLEVPTALTPMGRLAKPEEVATAVAWLHCFFDSCPHLKLMFLLDRLASEEASYITGIR
jgi:NAD(P)-dependent dehydrogenase (short-subunit alcohol dehydrogenase family)